MQGSKANNGAWKPTKAKERGAFLNHPLIDGPRDMLVRSLFTDAQKLVNYLLGQGYDEQKLKELQEDCLYAVQCLVNRGADPLILTSSNLYTVVGGRSTFGKLTWMGKNHGKGMREIDFKSLPNGMMRLVMLAILHNEGQLPEADAKHFNPAALEPLSEEELARKPYSLVIARTERKGQVPLFILNSLFPCAKELTGGDGTLLKLLFTPKKANGSRILFEDNGKVMLATNGDERRAFSSTAAYYTDLNAALSENGAIGSKAEAQALIDGIFAKNQRHITPTKVQEADPNLKHLSDLGNIAPGDPD